MIPFFMCFLGFAGKFMLIAFLQGKEKGLADPSWELGSVCWVKKKA
jgi:hypothetical protein